MPAGLKFYGASWCPDCARTKQYLGEHQVEYDWIDVDRDPAGAAKLAELNGGRRLIPTLVMADGTVLAEPTNEELAARLGPAAPPAADYHDLAIIGAGPTGLSAAIYTTREGIKTTLFEGKIIGGQASLTATIDNYPGFPDGVGGIALAANMEKQARRFGADIQLGEQVEKLVADGKYKKLTTTSGDHFAKSVLIASGSDYRKLGVPGESELTSKGVHYCATCDGPFYKDKELIVIGGGNSAMQEGIFLTRFATKITLLVRGPKLKGSEILIDKVNSMKQFNVQYDFTTTAIAKGTDGRLTVTAADRTTGPKEYTADGVFVFIGLIPNTGWLKGTLDLDEYGFIKTDKAFETSLPGVFAAGDVRAGSTLQVASAVGEGVTAALMIREYLKEEG